jgi:hypothetical protein
MTPLCAGVADAQTPYSGMAQPSKRRRSARSSPSPKLDAAPDRKSVSRPFHYLRAHLLRGNEVLEGLTLEAAVRLLWQKTKAASELVFTPLDQPLHRILLLDVFPSAEALSGSVVVCTEDEYMQRISSDFTAKAVAVEAVAAGEDKLWSEGYFLFYARGNHLVVAQSAAARAGLVKKSLSHMFREHGIISGVQYFMTAPPLRREWRPFLDRITELRVSQRRMPTPERAAKASRAAGYADGAAVTVGVGGGKVANLMGKLKSALLMDVTARDGRELTPDSVRLDLRVKLVRPKDQTGIEALRQVAISLFDAVDGDPTAVQLEAFAGDRKISSQRAGGPLVAHQISRSLALDPKTQLPELAEFHHLADMWWHELRSTDADSLA